MNAADRDSRPPRVLVVGAERSGTSWIGGVLHSTGGAVYLGEPDHPRLNPFAVRAVKGLGSHPVLAADATAPRAYAKLWDAAFGARPRHARGRGRAANAIFASTPRDDRLPACHPEHPHLTLRLRLASALAVPRHVPGEFPVRVVKSVRVHFALDWIEANWDPVVVVCRRHPLDVVASALTLDIPWELEWLAPAARARATEQWGVHEPTRHDPVTCMAWRAGLLMSVLDEQVRRHPEWHVVDHERVCEAPLDRLRELATSIGLEWTAESDEFVVEHERPGTGFTISRIAAEQSGKWRTRLSPDDARTAARVIAQFPIAERYELAV